MTTGLLTTTTTCGRSSRKTRIRSVASHSPAAFLRSCRSIRRRCFFLSLTLLFVVQSLLSPSRRSLFVYFSGVADLISSKFHAGFSSDRSDKRWPFLLSEAWMKGFPLLVAWRAASSRFFKEAYGAAALTVTNNNSQWKGYRLPERRRGYRQLTLLW